MTQKIMVYEELMQIEDELGERLVFQNGFRDTPTRSSLGAYGQVIDYELLYKAIEELPYTNEQWLEYSKYNKGLAYLSPPFGLLAAIIKRKIEERQNIKINVPTNNI